MTSRFNCLAHSFDTTKFLSVCQGHIFVWFCDYKQKKLHCEDWTYSLDSLQGLSLSLSSFRASIFSRFLIMNSLSGCSPVAIAKLVLPFESLPFTFRVFSSLCITVRDSLKSPSQLKEFISGGLMEVFWKLKCELWISKTVLQGIDHARIYRIIHREAECTLITRHNSQTIWRMKKWKKSAYNWCLLSFSIKSVYFLSRAIQRIAMTLTMSFWNRHEKVYYFQVHNRPKWKITCFYSIVLC